MWLLLIGVSSAEMACQEMPCCAQEEPVTVSSTATCEMSAKELPSESCQAENSQDCQCSLESEQAPSPQEDFLGFNFRFEFRTEGVEQVILAKRPDCRTTQKPNWQTEHEIQQPREHISFSRFPNPPPQRS